jgi:hypothetical protein
MIAVSRPSRCRRASGQRAGAAGGLCPGGTHLHAAVGGEHCVDGAVLAKKDAAIVAQVKENWTQIESLFAAHPYAINVGPVRPGTPRMVGLHPDHPNPKAKKKKTNGLDL